MSKSWRYVSDEEHAKLLSDAPKVEGEAEYDEVFLDIYRVVEGWVCQVQDGVALDLARRLPPGCYVKVLMGPIPDVDWCYRIESATVICSGQEIVLRPGMGS
jgi:hypothetical protein